MTDVLERIARTVRRRLEEAPPLAGLEARAWATSAARAAERRSLAEALRAPGVRVIAECKRRSPSAGVLREPFDPVALARSYQAGGAAGISVVTEPDFFAGEGSWVGAVRGAVALPVLRKDFIVCERQLLESVLLGADAVLLIVRLLDDASLAGLVAACRELGLETLVEVHDAAELERALAVPAPLVGINARDLRTFAVDLDAAADLAARVPADRVAVLESGVGAVGRAADLVRRGVRRFLVGEHLLRAADPRAVLEALIACA